LALNKDLFGFVQTSNMAAKRKQNLNG